MPVVVAAMPMKTIVTGGAGFIGSHMVDRLLQEGHQVTVLDDFSTGRPGNLAQHRDDRRLAVVKADVSDLRGLRTHFEGADAVFHFAALADIVPSIVEPARYFRANVLGTMAVAECCRLAGVRKLLYAASSSCYGLAMSHPTPEEALASPQYPYALTKYLGEQTVLHWGQVYRLPVLALRLFNVFGPRSRTAGAYGAVFGVFLAQKLAGRPYTVVGDGEQTRDFVFVSDVVDAFHRAWKSEVAGECLNVGSGGTYSINCLVRLLGGDVVHIPKRPGEPDCTFADIGKIGRLLGWRPQVSFSEGVARMLEHIEDWRQAPVWTPEHIAEATQGWFRFLAGR
jgi:UDP-glucose 4-epimerase